MAELVFKSAHELVFAHFEEGVGDLDRLIAGVELVDGFVGEFLVVARLLLLFADVAGVVRISCSSCSPRVLWMKARSTCSGKSYLTLFSHFGARSLCSRMTLAMTLASPPSLASDSEA